MKTKSPVLAFFPPQIMTKSPEKIQNWSAKGPEFCPYESLGPQVQKVKFFIQGRNVRRLGFGRVHI